MATESGLPFAAIIIRGVPMYLRLTRLASLHGWFLAVIGVCGMSSLVGEEWLGKFGFASTSFAGDSSRHPLHLASVSRVAAGEYHVLAVLTDGTVVGWGCNEQNQIDIPAGLTDVKEVAAGAYHSVALKNDGTVVGWGGGGDPPPAGLTNVKHIAAGAEYTIALLNDGTVVGWGRYSGASGSQVPAGLNNVRLIAAGVQSGLALKNDDSVVTWPGGSSGIPSLSGVESIVLHQFAGYALKNDHSVIAWGSAPYDYVPAGFTNIKRLYGSWRNLLGIKTNESVVAFGSTEFELPVIPGGLGIVSELASGNGNAVALKSDGSVVAWGRDGYGEGTAPSELESALMVANAGQHMLILRRDGSVLGWGGTRDMAPNITQVAISGTHAIGLRDDGTVSNGASGITTPSGVTDIQQVAASSFRYAAVKTDGSVIVWQPGHTIAESLPIDVHDVVQIVGGGDYFAALRADGTVVAWGDNGYGQLDVPLGLGEVVELAAGTWHTLALTKSGSVIGWGRNSEGQLLIPNDLDHVQMLAGGSNHSMALKDDGTVVTWGSGPANFPADITNVRCLSAGFASNAVIVRDAPCFAVQVEQAVGQNDPSSDAAITFTITFASSVDAASFSKGDLQLLAKTGGRPRVTSLSSSDGVVWTAQVTGMADTDGEVSLRLPSYRVANAAGGVNLRAESLDNIVQWIAPPSTPGGPGSGSGGSGGSGAGASGSSSGGGGCGNGSGLAGFAIALGLLVAVSLFTSKRH